MNALRMLADCMIRQDPQIPQHFDSSAHGRPPEPDRGERLPEPEVTATVATAEMAW